MGERNSPDAGETTLAAATAAIITARWPMASQGADPYGANGQTQANGHASPAYPGANGDGGMGGNGSANGGYANGGGYGAGGYSDWAPPSYDSGRDPGPAPFAPPAPPVSSAPPATPAPFVHGQGAGIGAAAASFFAAAQPEAVPEVFSPERVEPGPAPWDLPRDEVRTQVPPGFERRNFGPFADEPPAPPAPPAAPGSWGLTEPGGDVSRPAPAPAADGGRDVPRGYENPPSALLGVLPSVPPGAPMPATFAPPEPAPWVDSGWVDFPREESVVAPEPALVGAGIAPAQTRNSLPRRVPRPPDGPDFPLFDEDPAEVPPDPAPQRQELNRIADFLRDDELDGAAPRPDGIDLEAVLGEVRRVPEVRDAQVRWNGAAGHTLRIEFADGVDESEVTRSVVRLLRTKLGLAAQPSNEESTMDSPYRGAVPAGARVARTGAQVIAGRPLPRPSGADSPRLVVENVTVTRLGAEATVEVRLRGPGFGVTVGEGRGPGVDAYLSRIAATAAANAVDKALMSRGKVFIEHVSVVPFGVVEVAVVVLLLAYEGATEQLAGSAIVGDDPQQAVVRATLAALNRRLESLLA